MIAFIEHSFIDASHAAFVGVSFIEHSFIDASHAAFRDNRLNTVHENDSDSPLS